MLTQIYEVASPHAARLISSIGVLVGDGEFPREQPIEAAARIAGATRPPSKFAALFLTTDVGLIEAWVLELNPAIVHLGAAPDLLKPAGVVALWGTARSCGASL